MADRKPLFMGTEGFHEEMSLTDGLEIGNLTINSGGTGIVMNGKELSGLPAATSSPAGQPLVFNQTGAGLGDLTIVSGGDINVSGGGELIGLPSTPSTGTAAASKDYVDSIAQGLVIHPAVKRLASSDLGDPTTLDLTPVIDGASPAENERVLLIAQSPATENGIWIAHAAGGWLRAADMGAGYQAAGSFAFVTAGTTYADTGWVCTAPAANDTVGTDSLPFSQFSAAGTYTAGDGLVLVGSEFKVDLTATPGLEFSGGNLQVKVDPAGAIERLAAGIGVKLEASNPSLQISTNELGVKLDPNRAVTKNASGIGVNLETANPALSIATNKLDVKYQTLKGLDSDASGLKVKVDGTTVTFDGGGNLKASAGAEAEKIENSLTTATDATLNGDPVYINGANVVGKADAGVDAKSRVIGVIRTGGGIAGSVVEVVSIGRCTGILSGATPNTPYYLQNTGGIGTSLPGANKRVIQVGKAFNTTDLWVDIIDYGKKAA